MIKKVPIPMAGLSLGFAALGNLLQSYSESIRLVCGSLSAVLAILFLCKCVFHFDLVKEDMKNPVMASISGTFSMAVILLSAYAKPFIGGSAVYIWYFGIALHVLLMLYFTARFLYKLNMKTVFASYYIVYVGIVTASVTAPAFGRTGLVSHFTGTCDGPVCKIQRNCRTCKTAVLHLYGSGELMPGWIPSVCRDQIRCNGSLSHGIGRNIIYNCADLSAKVSCPAFLSKLCSIYIPGGDQCHCNEDVNSVFGKNGICRRIFTFHSAC